MNEFISEYWIYSINDGNILELKYGLFSVSNNKGTYSHTDGAYFEFDSFTLTDMRKFKEVKIDVIDDSCIYSTEKLTEEVLRVYFIK